MLASTGESPNSPAPDGFETQMIKKVVESKPWLPITLYIVMGLCSAVMMSFSDMSDERWNAMSKWQAVSFFAGIVLNVTTIWKTTMSKSTRS